MSRPWPISRSASVRRLTVIWDRLWNSLIIALAEFSTADASAPDSGDRARFDKADSKLPNALNRPVPSAVSPTMDEIVRQVDDKTSAWARSLVRLRRSAVRASFWERPIPSLRTPAVLPASTFSDTWTVRRT